MFLLDLTVNPIIPLAIACVGLTVAVFMDQLQVIMKYRGYKQSQIATGYNNAMKVMVFNRFGFVIYFILAAFAIDTGVSSRDIAIWQSSGIVLLLVLSSGMVKIVYETYYKGKTERLILFNLRSAILFIAALLITIVNIAGLTLPLFLAGQFPEYRLTLANTGFVLNSISTVINVFYIENRLAVAFDGKGGEIDNIVMVINIARLLGIVVFLLGYPSATGVFG